MTDRVRYTAGFTLAELMMSIAIILILAAIAIPSIVTSQNNMRMVELNNAAQSIANAAQTQMTAMKVSGTWMALINNDEGNVKYSPATNAPDTDTYYMTASDARSNGIVPGLSIDESVRNGDYIIEFTASTAQVVSVFYTDGKSGFFGGAPESTNAAQVYYESEGAATDQATRLAHDPMIGYYEGTPAGATPEVALKNPVIWVDEESKLCVQNPNLSPSASEGQVLTTQTSIVVAMKDDANIAFVIEGLDEGASAFSVSALDGSAICQYTNENDNNVYSVVPKSAAGLNDTFAIDLNELSRVVQQDAKAQDSGLADTLKQFIADSELHVKASIKTTKPCVPAKAQAFIEWPAKVAKLTMLITNPALDSEENGGHSTAGHIKGTYIAPKAELVTEQGGTPVTDIRIRETCETFAVSTSSETIRNENIESTRQSYSGGWVRLSDAYTQKANVKATVGSYTTSSSESGEAGRTHEYQIYEIWINGARAGYLKQNSWAWEDSDIAQKFKQCVIGLENDVSPSDMTTLTIDTQTLYNLIDTNTDEGYEVYIRTTPKTDEVQTYFANQSTSLASYLTWVGGVGTTGSRGANRGAFVRQPFENEFGAPSTVALWNMTTTAGMSNITMSDGVQYPKALNLRIYYSATPAVAWSPDGVYSGQSMYTALPSAVLWLFEKQGDNFIQMPEAYVQDSRGGTSNNFALAKSDSADFEIPYNRDYLFYRVLEYCDQNGTRIGTTEPEYVPYTTMSETVIEQQPSIDDFISVGWLAEGNSAFPDGSKLLIPVEQQGRATVFDYDAQLAYGSVKLKSQYEEKPKPPENTVGLMYLEFDANNNVTGYYGSFGGEEPHGVLPEDNEIGSWDYRVLVPENAPTPQVSSDDKWGVSTMKEGPVNIDGTVYDSYSLSVRNTGWLDNIRQTSTFKSGSVSATYTYNIFFAGAVETSKEAASKWGTQESPWMVRTADHFVSQIVSRYGDQLTYITGFYAGQSFAQYHDIEMPNDARMAAHVFTGTYDGRNHRICNYRPRQGMWTMSNYMGLFPQARGATFSNIVISDVQTSGKDDNDWILMPHDSFGLLVGDAQDCRFEQCAVWQDEPSPEGTGVYLLRQYYPQPPTSIGGLVGKADEACVLTGCRVVNLSMYYRCDAGSDQPVRFGGLVGSFAGVPQVEAGPYAGQPLVFSVTFGTPDPATSRITGGLVGEAAEGSVIDALFQDVREGYIGSWANVEKAIGNQEE